MSSSGKAIQDVSVGNGGLALGCVPSPIPLRAPDDLRSATGRRWIVYGRRRTDRRDRRQGGDVQSTLLRPPPHERLFWFGAARFAGVLRESVTFNDGGEYECTTGEDSWSASYDTQGSTPASAPVGRYSGAEWKDGHELAFYVSSSGKAIQDVSVGNGGLALGCVGLAEKDEPLTITEVPLEEDGSFSAEGEQTGAIEGSVATFKYAFVGHLHTSESSGTGAFRRSAS